MWWHPVQYNGVMACCLAEMSWLVLYSLYYFLNGGEVINYLRSLCHWTRTAACCSMWRWWSNLIVKSDVHFAMQKCIGMCSSCSIFAHLATEEICRTHISLCKLADIVATPWHMTQPLLLCHCIAGIIHLLETIDSTVEDELTMNISLLPMNISSNLYFGHEVFVRDLRQLPYT